MIDADAAVALVRADVDAALGKWFPAIQDLEISLAGVVEGSAFVSVRWIHRGRNDAAADGPDDPFISLARNGAEIAVHGLTLVEDRGSDEPLFHRYVDWVGVYDQLGLAVSGRLTVDVRPEQIGQRDPVA
jgi:hypothetical protein